jgi:hypothetical protein
MDWVQFKVYLTEVTDLSQDALHIYAAALIQVAAALLLRRSLAHSLPWLCVFVLLAFNEVVDLAEPGKPVEEWQVLGGLQDVWNTLLLPTVLMLLARFAPRILTGQGAEPLPRAPSAVRQVESEAK